MFQKKQYIVGHFVASKAKEEYYSNNRLFAYIWFNTVEITEHLRFYFYGYKIEMTQQSWINLSSKQQKQQQQQQQQQQPPPTPSKKQKTKTKKTRLAYLFKRHNKLKFLKSQNCLTSISFLLASNKSSSVAIPFKTISICWPASNTGCVSSSHLSLKIPASTDLNENGILTIFPGSTTPIKNHTKENSRYVPQMKLSAEVF